MGYVWDTPTVFLDSVSLYDFLAKTLLFSLVSSSKISDTRKGLVNTDKMNTNKCDWGKR